MPGRPLLGAGILPIYKAVSIRVVGTFIQLIPSESKSVLGDEWVFDLWYALVTGERPGQDHAIRGLQKRRGGPGPSWWAPDGHLRLHHAVV